MNRDKTIAGAVVTGVFVLVAALISAPWWSEVLKKPQSLVVAGTVVDQVTNMGIGQAAISFAGRTETYLTEDNGNFRIEIRKSSGDDTRVRMHVTKNGYRPFDEAVTPPAENLVISLNKL